MNALAEQWPLLLVMGYVIVSLVFGLLSEWFVTPSDGENRAAKRERDWYESEFMKAATIRSIQRARVPRARRINAFMRWAGIPWRLRLPPPGQ